MKPSELHAVWSMPDNTRLTAKQYSFRLPVHVAAKLAALCELYPNKTRTQIVADLLATSIELAAEGLPSAKGMLLERVTEPEGTFDIFEDVGLKARYKHAANRHFQELERELGNDEPGVAYEPGYARRSAGEHVEAFALFEEVSR
jgi:hypothetical protein